MEMDISYDSEFVKRCFKCDETVLNNLNIVSDASNNTIVLWNNFQIFVYGNLDFETAAIIIFPEFQIHDLIIFGNYLLCLDCTGNVHTTSLKFKSAAPKRFKFNFQPREVSLVASTLYDEGHVLCLKYESKSYFLNLHKINTEFSLVKSVILVYKEYLPTIQTLKTYILSVKAVTNDLENMGKVFDAVDINIRNKYYLTVVTFDKIDVYGCLFSSTMTEEQLSLVKLYSCPSEICNLQVIDTGELNVLIGLTIGTLIKLSFKDLTSPQIIHLNIALNKFIAIKDTILYTNGISMWRADDALSKNIKFRQFKIRQVKDFIKYGDQIIFTTFMNLIYTFLTEEEGSYLKIESTDEYCSAERLLNNSECLQKIMEEVKKNDILVKTLCQEKNYITALSLSNRQDIMDSIITYKVIVYENYEDAIKENSKVILTNKFAEYFDQESFFFLIKITSTTEHKLAGVSNSLGDLRFHITLATDSKVIRTTTIKVTELIKKISFLIPLKSEMVDTNEMNVNIKIMSNIPGALDTKQKIWTILFRKNVTLHSEHFIKFNLRVDRQECLKKLQDSLEALILQTAINQHGNLFQFEDILRNKPVSKEWHMYVRLPDRYQEVFRNKDHYTKHLNSKKVSFFLQQFISEDFLKSKSSLVYIIGEEKVIVEIYNDSFTNPLLKLTSGNLKIALNMRNFLSDLIYSVFTNFSPGKEFISLAFYATVENLHKTVTKCIAGASEEEIEQLIEQFERNVIGALPI